MEPQITLTLGVFRRLDNRFEGLSDDSPRALELHNRRRDALHEVFEASTSLTVVDWGQTDDTRSHEFVELALGATASAVFSYVIVPGLRFLGEKLVEAAMDHATSEAVKAVVSWLRPKQEEKKILDFVISLPDGTRIQVDPPDRAASIMVSFVNGRVESMTYSAGSAETG
jgi:hypothetical protein